MSTLNVTVSVYCLFQQDDLLFILIESNNIDNVTLALKLGANVNVHHPNKVSTLIK